jgi:hypothetical protein
MGLAYRYIRKVHMRFSSSVIQVTLKNHTCVWTFLKIRESHLINPLTKYIFVNEAPVEGEGSPAVVFFIVADYPSLSWLALFELWID